MVRPSCVTKNGTFLAPNCTFLTLHNLYCTFQKKQEQKKTTQIESDVLVDTFVNVMRNQIFGLLTLASSAEIRWMVKRPLTS